MILKFITDQQGMMSVNEAILMELTIDHSPTEMQRQRISEFDEREIISTTFKFKEGQKKIKHCIGFDDDDINLEKVDSLIIRIK